jgi:hypothetical protein
LSETRHAFTISSHLPIRIKMSDLSDDNAALDYGLDYDEAGESSQNSDVGNDFLDLEASESDGISGGESDGESNGENEPGCVLWSQNQKHSFPHFCRLPPEIRRLIWEVFCPDLRAPSRVYTFTVKERSSYWAPWDGMTLAHQTAPARAVLATHRESRTIALSVFRDVLQINEGSGVLRWNKDTDVAYFPLLSDSLPMHMPVRATGFTDSIVHLALELDRNVHPIPVIRFLQSFPNLKLFYCLYFDDDCVSQHLRWCTSDGAKKFFFQYFEDDSIAGSYLPYLYCWPDLEKHRDFATREIPIDAFDSVCEFRDKIGHLRDIAADLGKSGSDTPNSHDSDGSNSDESGSDGVSGSPGSVDGLTELAGLILPDIEVWPMIQFCFSSGVRRFEKIAARSMVGESWDTEENSDDDRSADSEPDPDEYESDGINDGEIDYEGGSSVMEDDLAVLPLSDNDEPEGDGTPDAGDYDEGGWGYEGEDLSRGLSDDTSPASFHAFSPLQPGATENMMGHHGDSSPRFSSPEAESTTIAASEVESLDSDEAPRPTSRRSKRHVVASDSSSGEEEDTEEQQHEGEDSTDVETRHGRAQNTRARARIVLSDSDDDEGTRG